MIEIVNIMLDIPASPSEPGRPGNPAAPASPVSPFTPEMKWISDEFRRSLNQCILTHFCCSSITTWFTHLSFKTWKTWLTRATRQALNIKTIQISLKSIVTAVKLTRSPGPPIEPGRPTDRISNRMVMSVETQFTYHFVLVVLWSQVNQGHLPSRVSLLKQWSVLLAQVNRSIYLEIQQDQVVRVHH